MHRFRVLLPLLLCVPSAALAKLTPGRVVGDGFADLHVGSHAAPCVVDFDGDGARDLLVGEYLGSAPNAIGKVRFYPNRNTDESPRFDGWSYVQAAGADIEVTGKTDT